MNFTAYIQRQKLLIRERHVGEEFLMVGNGATPVRSSDEIFEELDNMQGLNTKEREAQRAYIRRADLLVKRGISA
ncbi:MAG: hypothetical protein J6B04_06750 [Clostridia bacterium]|nr:hypothetical protein [Clostridia bacterium]